MQIKLVKYGIFLHSCDGSLTVVNKLESWTNVLVYICIRGAFFKSHMPNPSHRHPTNKVRRVYPEFSQVSTVQGGGRGGGRGKKCRYFQKGCAFLLGDQEMSQNYEQCITIPRTFVQDWSQERVNFRPSQPLLTLSVIRGKASCERKLINPRDCAGICLSLRNE